jgi:hypothetical protein
MIQQSIKKYEEPAWLSNNTKSYNYTGTYGKLTDLELDLAIESAKADGIKVGQKYRYKSGGSIVTVVGFAASAVNVFNGQHGPTVVLGERVSPDAKIQTNTFNYSAHELTKAGYLELVTE